MGFSSQEYWRGLPFPSTGDFPDPGIKPAFPALQAGSLPTELWGKLPHTDWAFRETWVQSLGWEGPLEKSMATHSSSLAWRIPWTEEPGKLLSMGLQRIRYDWVIKHTLPPVSNFHLKISCRWWISSFGYGVEVIRIPWSSDLTFSFWST